MSHYLRLKGYLITILVFMPILVYSKDSLSLFFVGNSQTYYHDIPGMLKAFASSAGDYIYTEQETPGGQILFYHYNNDYVEEKVGKGIFDFVILQEQSQIPVIPAWREESMFWGSKALYTDVIQKNCSKLAFYQTIGYKYGGKQCSPDNKYCGFDLIDYFQYQDTVNWAYQTIADSLSGLLLPIGVAAKAVKLRAPSFDLWADDGKHPGVTGSYLAAAIMYASFLKKSPVGVKYYSSLDSTTATFLQLMADSIVFSDTLKWNWGKQEQALQLHLNGITEQKIAFLANTSDKICERNGYSWLSAPCGLSKYIWSTGDTNFSIYVQDTGVYTLSAYCKNGLEIPIKDTVHITYKNILQKPELMLDEITIDDTIWLNGPNDSVNISVSGNFYYWEWNDYNTNSIRTIKDAGTYYIRYAVDEETECLSPPSDSIIIKEKLALSANPLMELPEINVFPNPASEIVNIKSKTKPLFIHILSLSGIPLKTVHNQSSISVNELKDGFYLLNYSINNRTYNHLIQVVK